MKPVYLCIIKGLTFLLIWISAQAAWAASLTFGGIQKDDINDPGTHDWIAAVALSPDNRYVYVSGKSNNLILFRVP